MLKFSKILVILFATVLFTSYSGTQFAFATAHPEMVIKCYPIASQDPPIDPPQVELEDQFGIENVDLTPGGFVCEEALKHSQDPPADPWHWTHYFFSGTKDFGDRDVMDQFGTETVMGGFSEDLLVPADIGMAVYVNTQHLTSYPISGAIDPPPILVADQFGTSMIDLFAPTTFLTNTFKNGEGDPLGLDFKCYLIKSEDPVIDPDPQLYLDQFDQITSIDPDPATQVCIIAKKVTEMIGGELLPIDTTALLLAGMQTNLAWIVPIALSVVGIGVILVKKKF